MRTSRWLVCVASLAGVFDASACGPDFPQMLTSCRSRCLSSVTSPDFAFDARAAGSADPRLAGQEGVGPTTVLLELEGIGADAQATISAMRDAASGDEAYERGKGLPEATRLYTAGAVDFNHAHHSRAWGEDAPEEVANESNPPKPELAADPQGPVQTVEDTRTKALTAALGRFQQILQLPAGEAQPRILWATFMLGRCHALRAQPGDLDRAVAEFRQAAELVRAGADDPMGLGHAALGEAGRVALEAGHLGDAVKLYAEQAAAPGAGSAIESLRRATGKLLMSNEPVDPWVQDPVIQKALIAYAVTATSEYYEDNTCITALGCGKQDSNNYYDPPTKEAATRLVEAIDKLHVKQVQWPDQVAGLAYKLEKYDVVTRVLALSNTPYAEWIRAKMALHAGDLQAAAAAFARASKGFSTNDSSATTMPDDVVSRFQGEQGLTSLARSDYMEAFNQLLAGGYQDDARYVAERVLTLEELQRLVDKQNLGAPFRDLLARRLARAGRHSEALPYYESDSVRELAKKYLEYLQQAKQGENPQSRAAGWYGAARLEIESGMELRGAERCPDYREYDGSFGDSCGLERSERDMVSNDELARLAANAIAPDIRFHYRLVGVEHLMKAADELPRRSATFDAVLCQGVHLLQQHGRAFNGDLIQEVYRRYVHEGRHETWATNFGSQCPEPVFESPSGT